MKILKIVKLLVFTGALIFVSCSNEATDEITTTENNIELYAKTGSGNQNIVEKINGYNFIYSFNNSKGSIQTSLQVFDSNDVEIYESQYNFDQNLKHYKLEQLDEVLNKANSLGNSLQLADYQNLSSLTNEFIKRITSNHKGNDYESLFESVFFHSSILNVKKRSLEQNSACECTLHPGYLLNKNGFMCQEDFVMQVSEVKTIIENSPSEFSDNESQSLLNFLTNTTEQTFNFKELYSKYVSIEDYNASLENLRNSGSNTQSRCWLGLGSSHGCCGNYDGCCYYVNPICHIHDAMCSDCSPRWFCLSGCVPD